MSDDMLGVSLRDARGPINTLLERLAGKEGPLWLRRLNQLNRSENPFVAPQVFEVTSNGLSGESWVMRLEKARYRVGDYAKQLLRSKKFVPTTGVTYRLAVIRGEEFEDENRITSKIREEAARRGYITPSAEHAPLLRELVSDEEIEAMGLYYLVVMHEPIKGADGYPYLLSFDRHDVGRWLSTFWDNPDHGWRRESGFAFLVPQV